MNPIYHARTDAKKFGGVPEDYLKLHEWMDSSVVGHADIRHRAALHHTFGITLGEQIFGAEITNSEGKKIPVRTILQRHIEQDLGFLPTLADYLNNMHIHEWMSGTIKKDNGAKRKLVREWDEINKQTFKGEVHEGN